MTKTYAVISGKGGTGKTSLVCGAGLALSRLGYSCVCVDCDSGVRALNTALGVYDRTPFDYRDVACSAADAADAAAESPFNKRLRVLCAPASDEDVPEDAVKTAVLAVKRELRPDFILIDAPAGVGAGVRRAVCACDEAIVVSLPDEISLRAADNAADCAYRNGAENALLVLNRVLKKYSGKYGIPNVDSAIDLSRLPLLGVIPENVRLMLRLSGGLPLECRAYTNIARRLAGEYVPLGRI